LYQIVHIMDKNKKDGRYSRIYAQLEELVGMVPASVLCTAK
jgi:hypothetical protein